MTRVDGDATGTGAGSPNVGGSGEEVVAFLRDRNAPCPHCGYELRDLEQAKCPECGEPLELRVGSPRTRFGWLVLAMAPGCFSGVAAVILAFPIYRTIGVPPPKGVPIPIMIADAFGFVSAAGVFFMYRQRHRIMRWSSVEQMSFAGAVWMVHVLAFVVLILALMYL